MMKQIFQRHRRLYSWLLGDLAVIALYFLCRGMHGLMDFWSARVVMPLEAALGRLCSHTAVSVMEMLVVWGVLLAVGYVIGTVLVIARVSYVPRRIRGRRARDYRVAGRVVCTSALGAVCALMTLVALSCLLWGVNFRTERFRHGFGLRDQPVATEDLERVTRYFALKLSMTADGVERDADGGFAVPREEILARAPEVYTNLEQEYPFLEFDDIGVKAMMFSRLMSRMDFTGFYCAFTGEANVNVDSPACLLPSTVAHEMAHQRGIAPEEECNFLAVLSCVTSGDPVYEYSGYLMGYLYLGNALYQVDPVNYWFIRDTLPAEARTDLAENNIYWSQFRNTAVRAVSNTVYDGILKSYGEEEGIQSYGAMVDLLVAYYAGRL